jgi:hypothetical protein
MYVTIAAPTNLAYQGYYLVQSITSPTVAVLVPFTFTPPKNTAASGGGNVAVNNYSHDAQIENMSWQGIQSLGQNLVIVDRNGNPLWYCVAPGPGTQDTNRLFTVSGITLIEMDAGIVLVTVRIPW